MARVFATSAGGLIGAYGLGALPRRPTSLLGLPLLAVLNPLLASHVRTRGTCRPKTVFLTEVVGLVAMHAAAL
jgi:hypothetical protein